VTMKIQLVISLAALVVGPSLLEAHGKKHVHDEADMTISIDGKKVVVDFESPAHPMYGFEREPKDAKEMARREAAVQKLVKEIGTIVNFDAALGCKLKSHDVKPLVSQDGDHGELEATFNFECKSALKGKGAFVKIAPFFPEIKTLDIAVVGDKQNSYEAGKNGVRVEF